jgi:hypothetical protein
MTGGYLMGCREHERTISTSLAMFLGDPFGKCEILLLNFAHLDTTENVMSCVLEQAE